MNKKTLTLIGLAALIATAATFLFAAELKEKTDGKFHLVYLVSTDKVEVGAKAYVEPLFFTDGKRLVFAYDYCRQYYQRQRKKPETAFPYVRIGKEDLIYPGQIASDLNTVHLYCNNKNLNIDLSKYVVRDNTGLRLDLSNVTFEHKVTERSPGPGSPLPPVFPERGTATIRTVNDVPAFMPEVTIENGQQHFFLASDSTAILDRIAPAVKIREEELRALKNHYQNYVQRRMSAPRSNELFKECNFGYPFNPKGFLQGRGPLKLESVSLLASAVADLDQDGRPDVIVSLREDGLFERSGGHVRGSTTEIRMVFGNGHSKCYVWSPGIPKESFPTLLPLAFIWIGGKGYLVTTQSTYGGYGETYSMVSVVPVDVSKTVKTSFKLNLGPL